MKKHNFTALILVCVLTLQTVLGAFQMQVLAEDNMSWSETAAETVLIGSEETLPEDFSADPEGSTELPYAPEGEEDLTEVSGEEAAEDESSTALEYIGDTSETPSAGTDSGEEGIVSDDMAAFPSFEQTADLDAVRLTVSAEAGAFPEDAVLSAEDVRESDLEKIDKAVAEIRDPDLTAAFSYVFDIKILDQNGNAVQPVNGEKAEIAFELNEPAAADLSAYVYHVTEEGTEGLKAEKLDPVTFEDHSVLKASTDSFSYFVVELGRIETPETQTADDPEITADDSEDPEAQDAQTAGKTEVHATSRTNNIVGDVLAGQINKANSEETKEQIEDALEEYPLDPHDLSYYGDSLRVRYLDEENSEDPNYLVYRDCYLIISQEDSENYEVTFSEDGKYAYVTPAISEDLLEGRHGIIFLKDNISDDNILVFGGDPVTEGDSLTVPLKDTADISVSELFSDGHWMIESERKPMLRAGFAWNTEPEGTNWKGELTSFYADWPEASMDVNVWDLYFMCVLDLHFEVGFKITTTGGTNGRESVKLVGVSVPLEYIDLGVDYYMEVEFADAPLKIEGSMITQLSIAFGTSPSEIRDYRTMLDFEKVTVLKEADYNKDIEFYIGSRINMSGSYLSISIKFWKIDIDFGPLLSLNMSFSGGYHVKAKYRKDEYDAPDLSADMVHTCTETGKAGCLEMTATETSRNRIYIRLDLYFDDWEWNLSDSSEKVIDTREFYDSETYGSGVHEGICPHKLYKLPVRVWLDGYKTVPAADAAVSVNDLESIDISDRAYASVVTGEDGTVNLYVPYKEHYAYTVNASKTVDGTTFVGSRRQSMNMVLGANEAVDIVLNSDERIKLDADIIWDVDADHNEVYNYWLWLYVFRREAGTDNEWEVAESIYMPWRANTNKSRDWELTAPMNLPKFGYEDGRAFTYEYRFRVYEYYKNYDSYNIVQFFPELEIDPEKGRDYIDLFVDPYEDAAGEAVSKHERRFHVSYEDRITDEGTTNVITLTPMVYVTVSKEWKVQEPENKPESVYLALLQAPAEGWEQTARQQGVPDEWLPVQNPFGGSSNSLKDLMDKGILSIPDDISSIENLPLSICEVSDSNGWSVRYAVPEYRNGVKMQYKACELDASVIDCYLREEYSLEEPVKVKSFGSYVSIEDLAVTEDAYSKSAVVINTDPAEDNKIMGTVRWESYRVSDWWDKVPEYVDLTIKKDGEEIPGSAFRLKKEDYSSSDLWIWTQEIEDYDPSAVYTVSESIPVGANGPDWIASYEGLNAYNHIVQYNDIRAEGLATFDIEPEAAQDSTYLLQPYVREKNGSDAHIWDFRLIESDSWYDLSTDIKSKTAVKDISAYEFVAPDLDGYYKIIDDPYAYTRADYGAVFYNFTVHYLRQSRNLKLHITNEWDADESVVYPDEIEFGVYRDGVEIAAAVMKPDKETGECSEVVIDKDYDGENLRRLDDEGHKYIYTIRQKSIDGYKSDVVLTLDEPDDMYYTLKNAWVRAGYINIKGTVNWEGDEGKEKFRPQSVTLSVVNQDEERVRTVSVPVDGDGSFKTRYLPGTDSDGSRLTYSVIESHVNGYTITYSEPKYDEETRELTCNVTNTLSGYFPLKIKKEIEGTPDSEGEIYRFEIAANQEGSNAEHSLPLPVNAEDLKIEGEGEVTAEFLLDEEGVYLYTAKEIKGEDEDCTYDTEERTVLISKTKDGNSWKFTSWVFRQEDFASINKDILDVHSETGGQEDEDISSLDDWKTDTVTFVNTYPSIIVEKTWDIDLEGKDRPDSIQAVVQKNSGGSWESVRLVELNEKNEWKQGVFFDDDPEGSGEYRVRELKEESGLAAFISGLKNTVSGGATDTFDPVWSSVKSSGYYDALPESIKGAGDEGEEKLKEALGAGAEDLYDKLIEQLGLTTADSRIVFDKDDSDKGGRGGDDSDNDETNEVTYQVDGYVSVISGDVDAHKTKYRVTYGSNGGRYTIENKAVLDIDIVKKWYSYGVEDDDMPDSAWLVLLASPQSGAVSAAADLASAAGIDLGGLMEDFPVIDPIEGGTDPVNLISQLALGIDLNPFSSLDIIPKLAIAKAEKNEDDEDKSWRVSFVDSKYHLGIPMEYKGAELSSEVIRQIIKYLLKVNLPVSFNPFDMYISVPGKAKGKTEGFSLDDFDFSALISIGKQFAQGDLDAAGVISAFRSDTDLAASVINVKIDLDDDEDPDKLEGKKIWVDDTEENRPEFIQIHIMDGDTEVEGSPITLNRSDFSGRDTWTWEFELPEDADDDAEYVVSEEWPAGYAYKNHYTCERDDLDLTNTWHDEVSETVTVSGQVIWKDKNDQDGIRPDKAVLYLLANGSRVKGSDGVDICAETSEAGDWRFFFPNQPRKDDQGNDITYTVEEETTEVITGTDGLGTYAYAVSGSTAGGFVVTNRHTPETITLSGKKTWDDNDDQDGVRPESITVYLKANGEEADSRTVTAGDDWSWIFDDLPKYKAGKEITYTLSEDDVEGYTSEINGSDVTNTHVPETITLSGKKTWDDNDDQDGVRPENITVHLKANGEEADSRTVTAGDGWSWTFEDLPKYKDGKEIKYILTEDLIEDYTQYIDGMDVTNEHTPGKTQVNVYKWWDDADDRDGLRPESVTVRLLADGEDTGLVVTLNEENGWTGTFTDIDKMKAGREIVYTISEDPVSGYETNIIDGREHESPNAFIIRNIHKPETVTVSGRKVWDDDDDRDGIRPESITIRLKADNAEIDHTAVTADDDWCWHFADLPKYAAGTEIVYSVTEDRVDDYLTEVDGFNVTNTHAPGKTQVTVGIVWEDNNDLDEIRPDKVTVKLFADGEDTGERLILTVGDAWRGSFEDLDARKAGTDIVYSIEEEHDEVLTGTDGEGTYSIAVSGDMSRGFTVTNTHTPIFEIRYVLNGGSFDGSTEDIVENYKDGTEILIHEKPVREGYTFLYWRGSEYQPGDRYKVESNHTFTAVWEKDKEKTYTVPFDANDGSSPTVSGKTAVKTGDESNAVSWLMLLAVSMLALVLILLKRKRPE